MHLQNIIKNKRFIFKNTHFAEHLKKNHINKIIILIFLNN